MAEWLTAMGTILLALVAAFQDQIRGRFLRPRLELLVNLAPPDCTKSVMRLQSPQGGHEASCHYFRLRLRNSGNEMAKHVEVQASRLYQVLEDGSTIQVENFLPMNLVWSHVRTPYMETLSPGMEKLVDLGHIIDPKERKYFEFEQDNSLAVGRDEPTLALDTEVVSLRPGHILAPGVYLLHMVIGASNMSPLAQTLRIRLIGTWHDDIHVMVPGCFSMSLLASRAE